MAEAAGPSTGGAGVDTKPDDEHFVDKHQSELIKRVSNVESILDELLRRNVIQQKSYDQIKTLPTAEKKMRELISGPLKSSGVQGKDIFYEILIKNQPLLILDLRRMDAEAETMSTKKRLCETLNDLSSEELEEFKLIIELEIGFRLFSVLKLKQTNTQDIVELMVETYSRQYLGLTIYVLKLMNRTDLVQRLIDTSPRTKEKHRPSLMQRVETLESVIELLLETLKDLNEEELEIFKSTLHPVYQQGHSSIQLLQQKAKYIPFDLLDEADMQDTVCLMVQYYGQQSVEMTKESLKMMNRTDLVQRLSDSSSRPKKELSVDELKFTQIKKAATMGAVKELLLETLNDLSYEEQKNFTWFLQFTFFQRSLPLIPWSRLLEEDVTAPLVDVMVEKYGQKSVEVIREVLMDMNRTDLVQRLSETSSGLEAAAGSSAEVFGVNTTEKEKHSVEEDWPALIQKVESMESVIELLLETLKYLSVAELKEFKDALLSQPEFLFSNIPLMLLQTAHVQDTVFLMVQICGQKCVKKTEKILKTMERTDLVQRLSDRSSGSKKKHSADEHRSALIHKVATIAAVQQLLLKTLNYLNKKQFEKFENILQSTFTQKNLPNISWMWSSGADRADIVNQMIETYGQQSVELTREILMDMKRTDLVQIQRLSKPSSGLKEKHRPSLMQRVEMLESVTELLLETLTDLNEAEFEEFKSTLHPVYQQRHSSIQLLQQKAKYIPFDLLDKADMQDTVCLMVQYYGQLSVEMTKESLKMMNRTDLVQRLSDSSSRPKKELSVDEHQSAQIKKVFDPAEYSFFSAVTMRAVKELVLETLNDLSYEELKNFKWFLQFTFFQRSLPQIHWSKLQMKNMTESLVDVMVKKYGQKSVEVIREVLMDMNRTDLVQRLSETSSGLKEKHSVEEDWPALIQKVESMESVIELLLETLKDLSDAELKEFIGVLLRQPEFHRPFLSIPFRLLHKAHVQDTVFLMVQICGQKCVKKTEKILKTMKRTDLVQRLSDRSSGSKKKHSADEHRSALIHKVATVAAVQQLLLETLNDLSDMELKKFNNILRLTVSRKNLQHIFWMWSYRADRAEVVSQMIQTYGQQSVELTRKVLMDMKRTDQVQRLSKPSSGLKGPSRSLEHEDFGSAMQDSSDWTKLEPEVNSRDADEAPTYSLQSEAGNFECSVSGLRWVCKEKVSLKYQFCPWEEPMKRMERINYMPAGPLMNITVTAGKLDEAYLPHWICIDNNPEIRDKFAVLHIGDCGDAVEEVAEVTSSHVKLSEPHFSPLMVLVKLGWWSVDINCYMLIYKTNKEFLTLHVHLIPCDPGLKEELDNKQSKKGYQIIEKPHPEMPLRVNDHFILTAGVDGEEIDPEKLMLRYNRDPNFFEVHIKNANTDFKLMLRREKESEPVRICTIRKGDYQSAAHVQVEHFVDKHQCDLIARVHNIGPILDYLLKEGVIKQGVYDKIRDIPTTQEKMRNLYSGPLKAGGQAAKDVFFRILKKEESYLVDDLNRKDS